LSISSVSFLLAVFLQWWATLWEEKPCQSQAGLCLGLK
jgi:hypothetical protein